MDHKLHSSGHRPPLCTRIWQHSYTASDLLFASNHPQMTIGLDEISLLKSEATSSRQGNAQQPGTTWYVHSDFFYCDYTTVQNVVGATTQITKVLIYDNTAAQQGVIQTPDLVCITL